jgi:hypothetical protein
MPMGNVTGSSTSPGSTSGAVQYNASSSFAGDASNFFWDATNKRLGIDTASPSAPIHINKNGISLNLQRTTGSALEGIGISGPTNDPIWAIADFLYANNGSLQVYSYSGNISAITVTTTGKVGINTNTVDPTEVLEVVGNIKTSGYLDLSGVAAGSTNLKITKTNATPSTTYTAHVASTDPSGFVQILEGGTAKYIPFYT